MFVSCNYNIIAWAACTHMHLPHSVISFSTNCPFLLSDIWCEAPLPHLSMKDVSLSCLAGLLPLYLHEDLFCLYSRDLNKVSDVARMFFIGL